MKNYILDTSVILNHPKSIYEFPHSNVIIPISVIEELDSKKSFKNQIGANAREFFRDYMKLRRDHSDNISDGIKLENKGTLRIEPNHQKINELTHIFTNIDNDKRITAVAIALAKEKTEEEFYLITNDYAFIVQADIAIKVTNAKNLSTSMHQAKSKEDFKNKYTGNTKVKVSHKLLLKLREEKKVTYDVFKKEVTGELEEKILLNQFVCCVEDNAPNNQLLCRLVKENDDKIYLRKIIEYDRMELMGIKARENNNEQKMLVDLLMDQNTDLVTSSGLAGSGKTLLALASAIALVESSKYKRISIARPNETVGKDHGFLPGDLKEKYDPWMKPIYDNIKEIYDVDDGKEKMEELGYIDIEPIAYIRGRTIPDQIVIIDEAQNVSPDEAKAIVTRAGLNSKFIFLGDTDQIDNPYLDQSNNALAHIKESMKGTEVYGHIDLIKCEKSKLAELAAKML